LPTLIYFVKEYNTYIVGKKLSLIYNERERERREERKREEEKEFYIVNVYAHIIISNL